MPRHTTDDFWLAGRSDSDTVFGADDGQLLKAHRVKGEHLTFVKVRCSPL
jgi:hypothetical protein